MRKLILLLILSGSLYNNAQAQNGFLIPVEDIFSIMKKSYPLATSAITLRGLTCTHTHELDKMPGTYEQKRPKEGEVRLIRQQEDTGKVAGLLFVVSSDSIRLFTDELIRKGFIWKKAKQKLNSKHPVPEADTELISKAMELVCTVYQNRTRENAFEVRFVWRGLGKGQSLQKTATKSGSGI